MAVLRDGALWVGGLALIAVVVTLAGLLFAPYAPWSSDRSVSFRVSATSWGRRRADS